MPSLSADVRQMPDGLAPDADGDLLFTASSSGRGTDFWYEAALFRTADGRIAASLAARHGSPDQADIVSTGLYTDLDTAIADLRDHEPADDLVPDPSGAPTEPPAFSDALCQAQERFRSLLDAIPDAGHGLTPGIGCD